MVYLAPMGGVLRRPTAAIALTLLCLAVALTGCGGAAGSHPRNSNHHELISIVISPVHPVVPIGDSERFAVTGNFSDGSSQDVTSSVTWSSGDPAIATIDKTGMAAAKHAGSAAILAVSGTLSAKVVLTVPAAGLISISITTPVSSVLKGGTVQVSAMGTFTDGSTKDVTSSATWASSDSTIAAVTAGGLVSGVATGSAMITATDGAIRGAETFTVAQATLTSLTVSPGSAVVAKGRTQQLTVSGAFSDGSTQDVTSKVAWTVSPSTIATVGPAGLLSTSALGKATVTAVSGSISATAAITVGAPVLTALAITPPNPSIIKGGTEQLAVVGTYSDGSTQTITNSAAWTVSSANIVSVSNSGLVTTLGNGIATVTATAGSVSATDLITVNAASLLSIVVSPANVSLMNGKTQQLTATGTYNDGSTQDLTSKVSWTGAVAGVVDLSSAGLLTAKGAGTATVTATSGSVSATGKVTVTDVTLTSIAITPANVSVPKGETQQLAATGTYSDGSTQDLSNKVTWSGAVSGVLDLGINGLVTARGLGSATITATLASIAGTTIVTVSAAAPVSLTVLPTDQIIYVGATQQFHASEILSDGSKRNLTSGVSWSSANSDLASISPTGLATGVTEGTATITANYKSVSGSTTLTMKPLDVVVTETIKTGTAVINTYFNRLNILGVDETLRIANVGDTASMCALIYVFAADQQLTECCGCRLTRNGLLSLSINNDLTSNPLTGKIPSSGTVRVVPSQAPVGGSCDAGSLTPGGSLRIWATHLQSTMPLPSSADTSSNSNPSDTPVADTPALSLQQQCQDVQSLGSGQGTCSCGSSP